MTEVITELGRCQIRSGTARPCPRPAVVKIRGVPFCEQCACEQEAYFAIGEVTEAPGVPTTSHLSRCWIGCGGSDSATKLVTTLLMLHEAFAQTLL